MFAAGGGNERRGLGALVQHAAEAICARGRYSEAGATLVLTFLFVGWTGLALAFYIATQERQISLCVVMCVACVFLFLLGKVRVKFDIMMFLSF
jgi:hypothetical protein